MGYPMTWQRFVMRNGLNTGSYEEPPPNWTHSRNVDAISLDPDKSAVKASLYDSLAERLKGYEQQARNVAGDLRRFESDARDEQSINAQISRRTGLPRDDVAAVLKEFFAL